MGRVVFDSSTAVEWAERGEDVILVRKGSKVKITKKHETPTRVGGVLGAGVGQELGQTSAELIRRGMNIAPTIEIRPGYAFNVMVTQDLVFPGPYAETVRP